MIAATIRTVSQLQVLRDRAAAIRRGDQVALVAPEDTDGHDVAGAVTAVRAGADPTVATSLAGIAGTPGWGDWARARGSAAG